MNEQQNNGLSVSFRIDDGIIEHNNRSFIAKAKRINRRVDIYESVLEWNYIVDLTRTQIDNNR